MRVSGELGIIDKLMERRAHGNNNSSFSKGQRAPKPIRLMADFEGGFEMKMDKEVKNEVLMELKKLKETFLKETSALAEEAIQLKYENDCCDQKLVVLKNNKKTLEIDLEKIERETKKEKEFSVKVNRKSKAKSCLFGFWK